jgi:hypothetical protein
MNLPLCVSRRLFLVVAVAASLVASSAPAAAPPAGQTVFSAGHSFHMFMPGILAEIAKSAGIEDHKQVGVSSIGGSYVHQHWAKEGDQAAKVLLPKLKPDVFTMAPIYLPDDGIENFVKLITDESPQTRILLQEFWLPHDIYKPDYKKTGAPPPQRDEMTVEYLRTEYGKYFTVMDAHVVELNQKYPNTKLNVTPVGQAVVALREKVIAGECPGVTKQSELFTDPIGHCTNPIKVLNAYCHFGTIYKRSPVGLPVPKALGVIGDEATTAKLNTLLQEIAWSAVTSHPLSGVQAN